MLPFKPLNRFVLHPSHSNLHRNHHQLFQHYHHHTRLRTCSKVLPTTASQNALLADLHPRPRWCRLGPVRVGERGPRDPPAEAAARVHRRRQEHQLAHGQVAEPDRALPPAEHRQRAGPARRRRSLAGSSTSLHSSSPPLSPQLPAYTLRRRSSSASATSSPRAPSPSAPWAATAGPRTAARRPTRSPTPSGPSCRSTPTCSRS